MISVSIFKERVIGAVSIMTESDAKKIWTMILNEFAPKDFSNMYFEEVEPDEDEKLIFDAYESGDPEYQPYMTHEQLIAKLGL